MTTFNKDKATADTYRGTLKGNGIEPVTFGDEVQSGLDTAGGDNDLDSVVGEVRRDAGSARALAETNKTKLDSIVSDTTSAWHDATTEELRGGYEVGILTSAAANPATYLSIGWDSSDGVINPDAGDYFLYVSTPSGIGAEGSVRVVHNRGGSEHRIYTGGGEDWDRLISLRGVPSSIESYRLVADLSGSPIAISIHDGDTLQLQVAVIDHTIQLEADIASVRALAELNKKKLDALASNTDSAWAPFTQADVDAGYAWAYAVGNPGVPQDGDFNARAGGRDPVARDSTFPVQIRVPSGISPNLVRFVVNRGVSSTLVATHPAVGEQWAPLTGIIGARAHMRYYRLADGDGNEVTISPLANDALTFELDTEAAHTLSIPLSDLEQSEADNGDVPVWNATEEEWEPEGGFAQIFDTFPDASGYSVGKNIIVRGQSYRLTASDSDELKLKPESVEFEGPNWPREWVGFSLPGFGHLDHIPAAGAPEHNPNYRGAPVLLGAGIESTGEGTPALLENQRHFTVAISEAAYRTGFGQGNIVAGEAPLWVRTIGQIQGAARSVDQQLYYYVQSTVGGTNYLFFTETYEDAACPISEVASPQSALCPVLWIMQDAITRDTAVTVKMWAGTSGTNTQGSPFVPDTSKPVTGFDDTGWTLTHDRQVVINERAARAIGPLTERVEELEQDSAGQSNARFQALEDKTSHIDFDENPTWVAADNTADSDGKHPYGKWAWISNGQTAANYTGLDFDDDDDFDEDSGDGFSGAGSGLLWVLPNNLNWSHVRLVVRLADGSVRSNVLAQGLRNAPSSLTVANLPASPPDVTVRWSASSDTHPFAVSNIEPTDMIALEVLPPSHVPVWNGEVGERTVDFDSLKGGLRSLLELSEATLPGGHLVAFGGTGSGAPTVVGHTALYEYPDYAASNESFRVGLPDATGWDNVTEITGFAISQDSGIGYANGNAGNSRDRYLRAVNLKTGNSTRVGNATQFNIPSYNDDTLTMGADSMWGIAINRTGNIAYMATFTRDETESPVHIYSNIHQLNLSTGVAERPVHQRRLTFTTDNYRALAFKPDDESKLYSCSHEYLYEIDLSDGTSTRVGNRRPHNGSNTNWDLESIAVDPTTGDLVALVEDGNIYVWNPDNTQFELDTARVVTNPLPGSGNLPAFYELAFQKVNPGAPAGQGRVLPELPPEGERDGLGPKFVDNGLQYTPVFHPSTILANSVGASISNNLNNLRWEAHPNALGTGTVGTASSGTVLTIDGRQVAKSKTFGIIVRIERGTPIRVVSEVFIPWSQFRTGSGTYVTNAVGAIRQGIFAGFWDDSRANSVLFAECTMHESNGQLQLKVDGAYGDPSSRMTVHLAR